MKIKQRLHKAHRMESNFKRIAFADNYFEIEDKIKITIESNIQKALNSTFVNEKCGIFSNKNFADFFTPTGSLVLDTLDELGNSKLFFTEVEGRYLGDEKLSKRFILRGPRYLAAIDESLSVTQKLQIFIEDVQSGLDLLRQGQFDLERQYLELTPVLDYIKNALITLYNAYTHRERLGSLQLKNQTYQSLKRELLIAVNESVISFYLSLVNRLSSEQTNKLLDSFESDIVTKIHDMISTEFKMFQFSSRTVVRPESCHPLVLAAFAYNIAETYPNTGLVLGLPSGGTEIACLIHKYLEFFKGRKNQLVLLPISIHSSKYDFNFNMKRRGSKFQRGFKSFFPKTNPDGSFQDALLVDDNSCTGETLAIADKLVMRHYKKAKLTIKVAEADTTRAKLKAEDSSVQNLLIASPEIFSESVNILPISKRRRRKHDLRELFESEYLYKHYHRKQNSNLVQEIKNEIIADAIRNRYTLLYRQLDRLNSIQEFKHTFLSNFWAVEIIYNGEKYPSVEHAYIAQKYISINLKELTPDQISSLNEVFEIKGIDLKLIDFSHFYYDRTLPAGVVKRISNKLQGFGIKLSNWDDLRLDIMVELLIQKFSKPELSALLKATKDKYLVEGNDWNDTFWGITGGTVGKNFLGRIIMAVRSRL
jgi:predicted NAD-dependent protein-ADP-ribosyltransferase YbiA (DUF1768 family)/hypoxanthine phosphoribosyltransferase